jgi:uncharacterized protein (DUF488 family)
MNGTIYTIGYTGFYIDNFINILKSKQINVVIDVRSSPYSERYPDYNKNILEAKLKENGIFYRNYVSEFGARQENVKFYTDGRCLNFELFAQSEQFLSGVEKIKNSIAKGYKIVLLCAEKEPIQCHRTILVSRAFSDLGYNIIHLMPDDQTKTQKQIEQELLDKYFPNRGQMTLFSSSFMSDEECLVEAYKIQNKKIGYKLEGEEE